MEAGKPGDTKQGPESDRRANLRWLIGGLVLLVAVVAWVATRGDDGDSEPAQIGTSPRIVSEAELEEIAGSLEYPIYWAGQMEDTRIELSEDESGVLLRYLAEGTEPGQGRKSALAIGSYPVEDAVAALDGYAERDDAIVRQGESGGKVVTSVAAPSSVYFASPEGNVQVEVYAAAPERAMSLAVSGQVEPVS